MQKNPILMPKVEKGQLKAKATAGQLKGKNNKILIKMATE